MTVAVNPAVAVAFVIAMRVTNPFTSHRCPMTSTGVPDHPWIFPTTVPPLLFSDWLSKIPDAEAGNTGVAGQYFTVSVVYRRSSGRNFFTAH
jgi:hypothetical protein